MSKPIIVRLTRHEASQAQTADLLRICEDFTGDDTAPEVVLINETLPNSPVEAVKRFDELVHGADIVEAVLPINLLEAIVNKSSFVKRGNLLIRSQQSRTLNADGTATFTFSHYESVDEVSVKTTRL